MICSSKRKRPSRPSGQRKVDCSRARSHLTASGGFCSMLVPVTCKSYRLHGVCMARKKRSVQGSLEQTHPDAERFSLASASRYHFVKPFANMHSFFVCFFFFARKGKYYAVSIFCEGNATRQFSPRVLYGFRTLSSHEKTLQSFIQTRIKCADTPTVISAR